MRPPFPSSTSPSRAPGPVDRSTLFRSDLLEIRANRCLRTDPRITPPTDPLPFHEICLPRRGVWIRHLEGRELVVNTNHVHFLNRGEVHRVAHPHGCGDLNTGLILPRTTLLEVLRASEPRADEHGDRLFRHPA